MGVRTKVIPQMRAYGTEPLFDAAEDYFKTTLCRQKAVRTIKAVQESPAPMKYHMEEKRQPPRSLLDVLRENPKATYEELALAAGVSPATVKRRIQVFKSEGLLRRIGSKKTGQWEVIP